MHLRVSIVIVAAALVANCGQVFGQAKASKGTATAAGKDPAADFDKLLADWKKIVAEMRQKNLEYRTAKPEDREKILEERKEIKERGDALEPKIRRAAEAAYVAAPDKNTDAAELLIQMAIEAQRRDQYDESVRLAKLLIDNGFENKQVYALAGISAYYNNDFETAIKYLKIAKEAEVLSAEGDQFIALSETELPLWKKEQEIRAAEAKADDLPRVKLSTTKGDIVLELFENEAPNTVANFISLVDKGFYDGTPFHRVLPKFMAQGGDPQGTGRGGPGYTIACECTAKNFRRHFSGSLSMAKESAPDTGGSQFFLTFVPTTHLDGAHTVFGRIISGMDVLPDLQRRDPEKANQPEPDKIIKAEVLRKRSHDYVPKTIQSKAADAKAKQK